MSVHAATRPEIKGTSEQIADRLRGEIETGFLPPGVALNQVELAMRFGLSRIPVREALRQLEAEGYIDYRPNKGATVVTALPVSELLEIIEIRECLECRLMQNAVEHMGASVLARAQDALDRMNRATKIEELRGMHERFHTILFDAADRPRMAATINEWRFRFDNRSGDEAGRLRAFIRATRDVHQRLLDACAKKNAAAVQRCVDDEYAIIRASLTR